MMRGRPKRTVPDPRAAEMAALFKSGKTHAEIGVQYRICDERVRQLLKRWHGLTHNDGGRVAAAIARRAKAKDDASIIRWGCTYAQYAAIRALKGPMRSYCNQRNSAGQRGIGWELNLWQWWTLWQDSGHWSKRGSGGDDYVMCRNGDVGPYAVGNVYFATSRENVQHFRERIRAENCAVSA